MTSENLRRIERMLKGIDDIANAMYEMESIVTYHCNRVEGHECREKCPMLVVLTSIGPVCAQRVIEQMHIQSHQQFDKVVEP